MGGCGGNNRMIGDIAKEVETKQIEILRCMNPSKKFRLVLDLTATSRKLPKQWVGDSRPE